jgi:hypothetical protein
MVPVDSSAARMPLPEATMAFCGEGRGRGGARARRDEREGKGEWEKA